MDGEGERIPNNSDQTPQISSGEENSTEMEVSLSSIAFKGPVSQAIAAAQTWRKILVVCIAGADEDSIHLEHSTWQDSKVVKLLSEHCVVLHLLDGSVDALHFSAFSMTAIGYNGVLLWRHEGYISTEDLIAGIEEARRILHLQEAAAASMMAAALTASSQGPRSNVSTLASSDHEGIANIAEPSSSADETSGHQSPGNQTTSDPTCETENTLIDTESNFINNEQEDTASASVLAASLTPSRSSRTFSSEGDTIKKSHEPSSSMVEIPEDLSLKNQTISEHTCEITQPEMSGIASVVNLTNNSSQAGDEVHSGLTNHNDGQIFEADNKLPLEQTNNGVNLGLDQTTMEIVAEGETDNGGSSCVKDDNSVRKLPNRELSSIHLQIRLLSGTSLQAKFAATDTLRRVKDYINENRTDGNRPYSLAIPYPRKVFSEEEMDEELSELYLGSRAAIILVPYQSATDPSDWHLSSQGNSKVVPSSLHNMEAGPGFLGRILSYLNPFSYFGGRSSNQESMSRESLWQYGANPSLQNAFRDGDKSSIYTSKSNTPMRGQKVGSSGSSSKVENKGWGSNIHTLKHDEDESFRDRNAFWNGNSTQFGGDDSKRD